MSSARVRAVMPPSLRAGDLVDVVAPGFPTSRETVEAGLAWLRSIGLRARAPRDLFGRDVLAANSDDKRARHLVAALQNSESRAVWCLRGGYGAIRLLPSLARARRPARPKLVIGLSDVTTLLLFLEQEWGWASVHGPLLDRFANRRILPKQEREMRALAFGELDEIAHPGLRAMNGAARARGVAEGPATGGNLIVAQSSLGTPWAWRTDKHILFFEETGERGYRVDRALEHMAQAGAFRRARAVVFGDFEGGDEPGGGNKVKATLRRFAEAQTIPVFSGLKTGHGSVQRPVVVGAPSRLEFAGGRAVWTQSLRWGRR